MNNPPERDHEAWPLAPNPEADAKSGKPKAPSWRTRLADAPPERVLFAVFCAVVGVCQSWLTFAGPKLWREAVVPYTGWSGLMLYLFCLFPAAQIIFAPNASPKGRHGIPAMLLLISALGLWSYLSLRGQDNFHNPYLMVSPWQPVLTVALPLAWAVALETCPTIRGRKTRKSVA